ncbi:MAG: class I SAM-dependent methyltransferase, partial [Roseiarcus sp.]
KRSETLIEVSEHLARAPYLVALASDAELPPFPNSVYIYRRDVDTDQQLRFEAEAGRRIAETRVAEGEEREAEAALAITELEDRIEAAAQVELAERRRAADLEQRLGAIEASSIWRATRPLRSLGDRFPFVARSLRRGVKLAWWTATLQLPRRYRMWRDRQNLQLHPALDPPAEGPAPQADAGSESEQTLVYDQDSLRTLHNHEFMSDPDFQRAYARGVKAAGADYHWHWRVHVALWAARAAVLLPGDFVECGVNRGFLSSAIMEMLDWNKTRKTFFLLDTFSGLDPRFVTETERNEGILEKNQAAIDSGFYVVRPDDVVANFQEWDNVEIIVGAIPDTLDRITARDIAFLSIDMNCSPPEVAAIEFLWDRLVPGAIVVLDDYAYYGYRQQKLGMDKFAAKVGVSILSLPTGQGLIVKPRS